MLFPEDAADENLHYPMTDLHYPMTE